MTSRGKILIVDDDNRNVFALSAVLKARGYTCISAISAFEGLEILKNTTDINMVLMDMMMPEMDGYEAIRQIKQNTRIAEIPVISVTAQAMVGDREKCIQAGADGYVSKPIDVDILTGLLKEYIKV